MVGIFYKNGGS